MPDATDVAYDEYEKKESSQVRKFSKAISTKQLFYIVAIIAIGVYVIFIKNPPVFDESNAILSDRYNSKLFMLNKKFIGKYKEKKFSEFELLPLSGLYP